MYKIDKQKNIVHSTGSYGGYFTITWNVVCKITESPCCTPETNIILQIDYT